MAIKNVRCESYRPGHNVHWIQAREKAHLPRLWAKVDLIGPKAVRVVTDKQDQVLFHHAAVELYMHTLIAQNGEIKYAPESNLLYVHLEGTEARPEGPWIMSYLSEGELTPCYELDVDKHYELDDVTGEES